MLGDNYPYWLFEKKEEYTKEEVVEVLTNAQMYDYLKEAIKRYGLEGTEEIIKRVYNTLPKLRQDYLKMLYEIWKG